MVTTTIVPTRSNSYNRLHMSLFKKEHATKNVDIIADVRSSGIGIALISYQDKAPLIRYTKRYPVIFKDNIDANDFVKRIMKELDKALLETLTEVIGKKGFKVKNTHVIFSSPWYTAQTKKLNLKREKSFTFTKNQFETLIKKEAQSQPKNEQMTIIEKDITQVILNGYEIHNPFDKVTKEIGLSFYIGLISNQTKNIVDKIIDKHFHKTKIKYHTHGSVLFNVLRDSFINLNNYIALDISGETTDIFINQEGMIKGIASIPYGKHDFVRNIGKTCDKDFDTILSSLKLLAEGALEMKCESDIEVLFKEEEKVWIKAIKEGLSTIQNVEQLPPKVCIIADNDFIKISEKLSTGKLFSKEIYDSAEGIGIITINQNKIETCINYDKEVGKDLLLELETLFLFIKNN